jgi:WD40 repeat protein
LGISSTAEHSPNHLGRFEIQRELGRGGFGIVFLAYDPSVGRQVALKLPRSDVLVSPEVRVRFHHEARAAAGLDHPNIVPVHEAGEIGAVCYIASAYCPGITLAEWLRGRTEPVGVRPAAELLATLADAVHHAHSRGVLHRDLKPANVLLQIADCRLQIEQSAILNLQSAIPKITDFGLAKLQESLDPTVTPSGAILGTPCYMAPEQAGGKNKAVSTAADVYSLGAILYEVLAGRPPFQGGTVLETLRQVETQEPIPPGRLRAGLPRDLDTICRKCLEKNPSRRYSSAAALADDLRRFLADEPVLARPVTHMERAARWCRRNPALAMVSGVAVLALLGALAVSISFGVYQSTAAGRLREALDDSLMTAGRLREANRNLEETDRRRREGLIISANMAMERALTFCRQGEAGRGLLWLARALEIAPPDAAELRHAIRTNLGGWSSQVHRLVGVFGHERQADDTLVALSPDGKRALTGSHDRTAQLWDLDTGRPIGSPMRHMGALVSLAFSANGKYVASGSADHKARVWRAENGQPVTPFLEHKGLVRSLAFSPDSRTLLTGSEDGTAMLWQIPTGKPGSAPLKHMGNIYAVAFCPLGKTVATAGKDNAARVWSAADGKLLHTLEHRGPVYGLAYSADGNLLATAGGNNTTQRWQIATGKPLGQPSQHGAAVVTVACSPNGKQVASGGIDQWAQLWDMDTGAAFGPRLFHNGTVYGVAFSPDSKLLATGSADGTARLWGTDLGRPYGPPLVHGHLVAFVRFLPDAKYVVTGGEDQIGRIWEITKPGPAGATQIPVPGDVLALCFGADARTPLIGIHDPRLGRWEVRKKSYSPQPLKNIGSLEAMAFHPVGSLYAMARQNHAVEIWDSANDKPTGIVLFHPAKVVKVAFSPDGKSLLTACANRVHVFDAGTGKRLGVPLEHPWEVHTAAFSHDGKTIITGIGAIGGSSGEAWLWDLPRRRRLRVFAGHKGPVRAVALSPDGTMAATGSTDRTARLWKPSTGRPLGLPFPHELEVPAVLFSPDSKMLFTTSYGGQLWDVATHTPLGHPFTEHGQMHDAVFRPDSKRILIDRPSAACLWKVPEPVADEVPRIVLWTQVLTGMELDSRGTVRVLDAAAWKDRRRRLEEAGGPPLH